MKIGVFDSGKGGLNILKILKQTFPNFDFVYISDAKNVPYGHKSSSVVLDLTLKAIEPYVSQCDMMVIACNTATTASINYLRAKFTNVKFVGLEPMVRPAVSITKTKTICVCATPTTLSSQNYKDLKAIYGEGVEIIEPNCSNWAELIENDQTDEIKLSKLKELLQNRNCDVLVLGCTHYHNLKQKLQKLLPKITILEPSDAIVKRVKSLLT